MTMTVPKELPKPDDWTDKQLSSIRRDSVQLATNINGESTTLEHANDIYNFIKDGKVPEPKTGGWK